MAETAITVIAARFAAPLEAEADASGTPEGAARHLAGTEIVWQDDGRARRGREVRIWFTIWNTRKAAEAHLARRHKAIAILAGAEAELAALTRPFASHGDINWAADGRAPSLYPHLTRNPGPDAPVMVITSLGLNPKGQGLDAFGRGVKLVRAAYAAAPDMLADVNILPDTPGLDGPTVTLWRSQRAMMDMAYRQDPHKSAMTFSDTCVARASFTRCRVDALEGNWDGAHLTLPG